MNKSLLSPVFYERTRDGEVFYDIQSRLIKDRVIFLSETITDEVAGIIAPLLFMMNNEDSEKKISIWINSPGGDVYAFYAIYDMMQMIKAPVETACIGKAMSAGAMLMAAGEKGKRIATPNSKFMIHQMQLDNISGNTSGVVNTMDHIKEMDISSFEILAAHTGNSVEKIRKDCSEDFYLNAEQALEYGLIDKIIPINSNKLTGFGDKKQIKAKTSKKTKKKTTKKSASKMKG